MIDDVCQEIIDSDSERFMWVAMHLADEIAGIDLHELASQKAAKAGRDEPNYEDYGDAVREAIDHAENMTVAELWRAERDSAAAQMLSCSHQWKQINGEQRCLHCGAYWIPGSPPAKCPTCKGTGAEPSGTSYGGQSEMLECSACGGTGTSDSGVRKSMSAMKIHNVAKWLRNGCDPLAAATELAIIANEVAALVSKPSGYDALAAENAALRAELAFARSTGDESALEYHALKARLAEAEALLEIVAPLAYAQWKSGSCDPVEAVVGLNEPITGIADSASDEQRYKAHVEMERESRDGS